MDHLGDLLANARQEPGRAGVERRFVEHVLDDGEGDALAVGRALAQRVRHVFGLLLLDPGGHGRLMRFTPYSGLSRKTICSHLMSPGVLFFTTTTLPGSLCWAQVRKSPSCIVRLPSPVKATTGRPGNAACAPMAYGRAAAMLQLVPL